MHFKFVYSLLLLLPILMNAQHSASRDNRPNVIFILADDVGWKDFGCYGSNFHETPHLDALAADGMRFTRAYAANPVCSPSRASIMTGKYPHRVGITDYINMQSTNQPERWPRNTPLLPAPYNEQLALDETTIAEAMKTAGYLTYFAGKWHLGGEAYWPENQGFDSNKGGYTAGQPASWFAPYRNPRLPDGPEGEYLPERLTNETVRFIRENRDTSFFIYHALYLAHTPLRAQPAVIEKYRQKADRLGLKDDFGIEGKNKVRLVQSNPVYAAMIEALDNVVGAIIRTLKEEGLYDHTIIIVTADNGGLSTAEGHSTSNMPLRAGKGWVYEGGIREPLIIRAPGITRPASISEALVCSPDFFKTILDLAGQKVPGSADLDGQTLRSVLQGKQQKKRTLFWHYPHYSNQGGPPASCIMKGDWKLIKWYRLNKNYYELFNVKNDISEKHDLSSRYPRKLTLMKNELERFLQHTEARLPTPNKAYTATK